MKRLPRKLDYFNEVRKHDLIEYNNGVTAVVLERDGKNFKVLILKSPNSTKLRIGEYVVFIELKRHDLILLARK